MPSLSSLVPKRQALEALLDDEGGHAARAGIGLGLGVDDQRVGVAAVGDPHLRAVEHVAVALLLGAQLHADHVGAGVGLAHRQRADVLAAHQLRQVLRFCACAAVAVQLVDAQVRMRAVRQADRRRGARHLLHRHDVRQVAEVGAAVLLAHRHAVQAEVAELLPQVGREQVVVVDRGGARRDLVGGEARARVSRSISMVSPRSKFRPGRWVMRLSP